jgi:purine-binding chemotaxis protein CheW
MKAFKKDRKDTTAHQAEHQLAVFTVGHEEYAIDIMQIMEIIRPQKVTRIPNAPKVVEGVMNLRGKVVPIIDLRKKFGADPDAAEQKKVRVIILRIADKVLGAVVDEVAEVIYMKLDQIEVAPDAVKGIDSEYLKGVGKVGDRLIIVLDVDKLLSTDEIRQLGNVEVMARDQASNG